MSYSKTNSKLIALINRAVPEALAVPLSEWTSNEDGDGIWFRGSEEYTSDGGRVFNYYAADGNMMHPTIQKLLDKHGYYAQPYDCGTVMAYT